jgi:hypothetical protein
MLDYFCIFTKGGTLLWALSFVGSLKGDPINTLIRACLLEERAAQSSYDYIIPSGGAYALKWSLNNVRCRRGPAPAGCFPHPCLHSHTALLAAGAPAGSQGAAAAAPTRRQTLLPTRGYFRPRRLSTLCHPLLPLCPSLSSRSPQGLGLVFVAVYQKALKLLYVDELLARANRAFSPRYSPDCFAYPEFDAAFQVGAGCLVGAAPAQVVAGCLLGAELGAGW